MEEWAMFQSLVAVMRRISEEILVVLVVLKLTGLIGWSWWWVTSPLWAPPAIMIPVGALIGWLHWRRQQGRVA